MNRFILAVSLVLGLAGLGACSRGPAATAASKIYSSHGVVRGFQSRGTVVVISHEAIPGVMDAMTMGYELKHSSLALGLQPGDKVDFSLVKNGDTWTVVAMKKVP